MKYPSYSLIALTSTGLVILLSLSSCSPKPKIATTSPMVMNHPSTAQLPVPMSSIQNQPLSSQKTAQVTIKIHNFKFEPASVTIPVGKTVQFVNTDEEPHTATSTDGAFDSKALDTNATWNYTASKPGTFPYICSIHPFMKGTLIVAPKKN